MSNAEMVWSTVSMSPRARKYYEKRFLPKYERYLKKVRETPLILLIWGPGASGGDLYEKRLQIRGQLRERGFAAVFSEEIEADCPVADFSSKAKELLQALSADLIVVLQASFGSTAEVHDFAEFTRDVGSKTMIFINESIKGGYSYTGALMELQSCYGNVHTFEYPRDVYECNLTTKVLNRAEVLRHAEWRRNNVR